MFWKTAMSSSSSSSAASGRGYSILDQTNLERFLDSVTPCLPLHFIPQILSPPFSCPRPHQVIPAVRLEDAGSAHSSWAWASISAVEFSEFRWAWGENPASSCATHSRIDGMESNAGTEYVPYFNLGDLWHGFDEASAYGVGTRVLFEDGDVVTQYFTPFLSAIQLFTNKPPARCDSDMSWSDDNESEKVSRSMSDNSSPTWESFSNFTRDITSSLSPDKHGHLYLNYCEFASPFLRVPLYEKVMEFAHSRPELLTLKSYDLSPSSWMAVLWYPIYNIPSQKRSKDLSTVFLTFYTLSSSSLGDHASDNGGTDTRKIIRQKKKSEKPMNHMIDLSPFGLSTFKLSGNIWTGNDSDGEKISCLQNAADSWLKQHSFFHHDFSFYSAKPADVHK